MVEEGLEKELCALESRDFIFSCSFGESCVCSLFPFPSCDGEGPAPPWGDGVHKEPGVQDIVILGLARCKGQYFGDSACVFLETKTFILHKQCCSCPVASWDPCSSRWLCSIVW